jgi:hypothetical protein
MVPPYSLRHLFVGERRSNDRVDGPADTGAAMAMGHSVRQWDKVYDQHLSARQVQGAVDAMEQWRGALLGACSQPQPQPAEQPLITQEEEVPQPMAVAEQTAAAASPAAANPTEQQLDAGSDADSFCIELDME